MYTQNLWRAAEGLARSNAGIESVFMILNTNVKANSVRFSYLDVHSLGPRMLHFPG